MDLMTEYTLLACGTYVFTAFPYENLGKRGFRIDGSLDEERNGCLIQTLLMTAPLTGMDLGSLIRIEFHEIREEEIFLSQQRPSAPPLKLDESLSTAPFNGTTTVVRRQPSLRGRDLLRPFIRFSGTAGTESGVGWVGGIPVEVWAVQSAVEGKAISKSMVSHPNTVQGIEALYLGLDEQGIEEWTQFLGQSPRDHAWVLRNGVQIKVAQPGDGLYQYLEPRKDFPFWAIQMKCHAWNQFVDQADPDQLLEHQGQPIALIKEHLTDWDLLIV